MKILKGLIASVLILATVACSTSVPGPGSNTKKIDAEAKIQAEAIIQEREIQESKVRSAEALPSSKKEAMAPVPLSGAMPLPDDNFKASKDDNFNTEEYDRIVDNPFLDSLGNPLSTFSIDVDTAAYANTRRFLQEMNSLPPPDAVRIEELINYFPYNYKKAQGTDPVSIDLSLAKAPWNPQNRLLRIALKAKEIETAALPPSNLVLLLDTSGSMNYPNKLPLLKDSLAILVDGLRKNDTVSIVAYAGSAGLVLPPTSGDKKDLIIAAFDNLRAGGSTAGGEGLELAYKVARENFIKGGNNRVVLATDGDFNVGVSSTAALERMIEDRRKDNVYLTILGLGMGNYKDDRMETLSNKGNGNYAYIDNLMEGKKVLGKELWGNLFAVAKDVKIQIEFNPAIIQSYRLIGYENRLLAKEDFNDDTKDAGEMGSGHTVTALYELVLTDAAGGPKLSQDAKAAVDKLNFQTVEIKPSDKAFVFKLRYKTPGDGNEESKILSKDLSLDALSDMDEDFRFASAVAEFGMLLRDSQYKGNATWKQVAERARTAKGSDTDGYRAEFIRLVELAELHSKREKK